MRKFWMAVLAPILVAGACLAVPPKPKLPYVEVTLGESTYRIPNEYRAGVSGPSENGVTTLSINFSRENLSPIEKDLPGWGDNISLLALHGIAPASVLYDHLYDGDPESEADKLRDKYNIKSTKNIGSGIVFHEMKSEQFDVATPIQDKNTLPLGFMVCTKFNMKGADNACQYFFDEKGVRWKISFGKRYIHEYQNIRRSVLQKIQSFELKGK